MARTRNKLLIVDGYNVLRSGKRYRDLVGPDYTLEAFNKARGVLIDDVIAFAGRDTSAVIVFDGGGNDLSTGEARSLGGVQLIFSPAGSSADKVIEKLAWDARARGIETLVVTSDAQIQNTVFGLGVDRMSADGFSQDVAGIELAREDEGLPTAQKNTVAGRLDGDVVAKLEALRDSLGR